MDSTRASIPLGLLASLFLATGCAPPAPLPEAAAPEPAEWGYSGEGAPERWGGLNADFALCESGTMQSPINLAGATRTDLPDLEFDYEPTPLDIENKGHTVQLDYQPGSAITVDGTRYELVQFHFHTPGEHQLQGREFPAALHLVHRSPTGELAVVGVLIERGDENEALAPVWNHLPRAKGEDHEIASLRVNAVDLLPATRQHFRYSGSLTTPPCTEGVKWFVLDEPIELSAQQIHALHSIIGTSNRPVQPLGTRELRYGR